MEAKDIGNKTEKSNWEQADTEVTDLKAELEAAQSREMETADLMFQVSDGLKTLAQAETTNENLMAQQQQNTEPAAGGKTTAQCAEASHTEETESQKSCITEKPPRDQEEAHREDGTVTLEEAYIKYCKAQDFDFTLWTAGSETKVPNKLNVALYPIKRYKPYMEELTQMLQLSAEDEEEAKKSPVLCSQASHAEETESQKSGITEKLPQDLEEALSPDFSLTLSCF